MMERKKVTEYVDIQAPREEVFDLVLNLKRRMQLSPLWGVASIQEMDPNFPEMGSRYHVKVQSGEAREYDTVVTEYRPLSRLAYQLEVEQQTRVTWTVQQVASGTRVVYEEEFLVDEENQTAVTDTVREVIRNWLRNIKNYLELRDGRIKRLVRWLMDRYFLDLRKDQRQVILTVLFMQLVGIISFIMAAIAMGIAGFVTG